MHSESNHCIQRANLSCRVAILAMAFMAFDESRLLAWQDQRRPPVFKIDFDAVQEPWSLKGRILSPSGKPMSNLQVNWLRARTWARTNENGVFTLSVPASAISPPAAGETFAGNIAVSAPGNLQKNFTTLPISRRQLFSTEPVDMKLVGGIEFHVQAKFKDGSPAPNVYICPIESRGRANNAGMKEGVRLGGAAFTNNDGETMLLIRPGKCNFIVGADDPGYCLPTSKYAAKMVQTNGNFKPMLTLNFVKGEIKTLELVLDRSPVYQVYAVLADGSPVADAHVYLMDDREQKNTFSPISAIEKTDGLGNASIQAVGNPSDAAYIICSKKFENGWRQSRLMVRDYHGRRKKLVLEPADVER